MAGSDIKIETVEAHYPALEFFVRHGHPVAALCGLAVVLFGLWLVLSGGMGAVGLVASLAGGCVVYLLVRVFWDMAKLIADTMIPR